MGEILHVRAEDIPQSHKNEHVGYEYFRHKIVPRNVARQCTVSVYRLPPGKSAYPYHWHTQNEEVFYIISGSGILKTPEGERKVTAGDFLFFPANESGAHKLTNTSSEELIYIDFDTQNPIDVALYPDSGKIGVWGMNINQAFRMEHQVGYYEGE